MASGAIHTSVELPNMYVFLPILPGLVFTTIIVGQIIHYRRIAISVTSSAK